MKKCNCDTYAGDVCEICLPQPGAKKSMKTPENISDVIENCKIYEVDIYSKVFNETLKSEEALILSEKYLRIQIEQLLGRIEDDSSFLDESSGRYNREIELREKIKELKK